MNHKLTCMEYVETDNSFEFHQYHNYWDVTGSLAACECDLQPAALNDTPCLEQMKECTISYDFITDFNRTDNNGNGVE